MLTHNKPSPPGPRSWRLARVCGGLLSSVVATAPAFSQAIYEPYTFTTLAGQPGGQGNADGVGAEARFGEAVPAGMVLAANGMLYVMNSSGIRQVTPEGAVSTRSDRTLGLSGSNPAFDGSGNLYYSERNSISKRTPAGTQELLAGDPFSAGKQDGVGSAARFNSIQGLAVDAAGNVFVSDWGNFTIRKIAADGTVTTFAGKAGLSGSADGTGDIARFRDLAGVAVDAVGNVYVASGSTLRKISPQAVVTTLAGKAGATGILDGTGASARFTRLDRLTADASGTIYAVDASTMLRRITADGTVTTLAGKGETFDAYADGTGANARFGGIRELVVDRAGNLLVSDDGNNCIRKVTPGGVVTTFAGRPSQKGAADGVGTAARFLGAIGLALDGTGNIAVADTAPLLYPVNPDPTYITSSTVRRINAAGEITTLAGKTGTVGSADGTGTAARFKHPVGLAFDSSGNLYVSDSVNNKIRKLTPEGVVTTFAGPPTGSTSGSVDGAPDVARFSRPSGLAADTQGNLYVADYKNNKVRKVTPDGTVSTVATVSGPWGLAVDAAGNVYVSSPDKHTVSKVSPAGGVTHFAGRAGAQGSADGARSDALFNSPAGVAVDGAGNVYVADYSNSTVRKITPAGRVTTLAGWASVRGGKDGTGKSALFNLPTAIAVDRAGTLYVTDNLEGTVRVGHAVPPSVDLADDFNDGNDDGWTRYDALAGVYADYIPAAFTVTEGRYRIKIPKPATNPTGYVRALPYRAEQSFTDFEVSADAVAWDESTGSWVGVLGRMNQIGTGKTAGYMLWYYPPNKVLSLNILRGEAATAIAPGVALTLDPTHQYRFTLTGQGERLTGTVVDLAAPDVVLASITGMSATYPSGYCGLLCGSFTGADVTYDNFVARVPKPAPPSLSLVTAPGVHFKAATRYPTGPSPHGIAQGDVNRDGYPDLVVANNRGGSVSVFLGDFAGNFNKQRGYTVGAGPLSPVVLKLDRDDFPDLVVANGNSTNVSVLLGKPDGTLADSVNFTVGSRPASIAVGDFNQDGFLDLVTANSGSTNVSVLLGHGDGTFLDRADSTVGKAPLVVRAADLNGDHILDLVTANSGDDTVSVLLGNGDGTFKGKVSYPAGKGPTSVVIGDFNGDGRPDVAVANRSWNSVMVLPGRGDGTLDYPVSTTFVRAPWDLVLADLNGDGRADLVVTTTVVGQVALLIGSGDGRFADSSSVLELGDYSTDAVVADFNFDQRPDLAVVCQQGDRLEVLLNRGKPPVALPAVEVGWTVPDDGYVLEGASNPGGPWSQLSGFQYVHDVPFPGSRGPAAVTGVLPGQRHAVDVERTSRQFFRLKKP